MRDSEFRVITRSLLGKYEGTPLVNRWQEAISFGAGLSASDYWIRDSGGAVNIVWLNPDGIRDVAMTWDEEVLTDTPDYETSFTFVSLKNVVAFDVREGSDIGRRAGINVPGDKLVLVTNSTRQSYLYWIANTPQEVEDLDRFLTSVLSAYLYAS